MKNNKFLNFLYYHWKKIILIIAVVMLFALTFVQCGENKKNETDFSVFYVSETDIMDEEKFLNELNSCGIVKDSNNEGGMNIKIKTLYIPESKELMQEQGIKEQLQLEFVTGECTLYILDSETIYENEIHGVFYDLTQLADKFEVPENKRYIASDGSVCAISLNGNEYLKNHGAPCDEQYLAIRYHDEDSKDPKISNALNMAEHILNNGK